MEQAAVVAPKKKLRLSFSGRILDHLGIQMYQSPVAAIAEMISNSWDADAEKVDILLPDLITDEAVIQVIDDGIGMTIDQCETKYLNVGQNRRGGAPNERTGKLRPVLGRKGIGKFAGFGIADIMEVSTVSQQTGERTVFALDVNSLRTDDYISHGAEIQVLSYEGPDDQRRAHHGTTITLRKLKLAQKPSLERFKKSMARRFLLHQNTADFAVHVNTDPLPKDDELAVAEFSFPISYEQLPIEVKIEDGWGTETLSEGKNIKWRICFYKKPIDDEELRGISVFANGKLAQKPFFFNLSGGLGGQHGQEYMTGQVQANYLDELKNDVIATERQRLNWELPETSDLLIWGQKRVTELLRIWKEKRAAAKVALLAQKLQPFQLRLEKLPIHERKIVSRALHKIASIAAIEEEEFINLGDSLLLAWEGGRLKELIHKVAETEQLGENDLLNILIETQVLTALHTAEAVKAKLMAIAGLHDRVKNHELENAVRGYIASNPWLIDPMWETFRVEQSVNHLIKAAVTEAKLDADPAWSKRVDLVLSSGTQLLVLEFMRPGLVIDWDHINRFSYYITAVRTQLQANAGHGFTSVSGCLVADKLAKNATVVNLIADLRKNDMVAIEWEGLLGRAASKWKDFLTVLTTRAPGDERLKALAQDLGYIQQPKT